MTHLAKYFINRHNTYCNKLHFNFPEHLLFFLKSIKKSTRKLKKSEIFWKNHDFSKKSKKSKITKFQNFWFPIGFRIQKNRRNFRNFWKFSNFSKNHDFSKYFQSFPFFSINFLWISNFFWCFGKLKLSSFQKVPCLFTKYAPLALCMAVSEKPVKKTVFRVKSSLLGIEVTKSALDLPDQCSTSTRHQFWSMLRFFADIIIFVMAQMDLGEVYYGTWHAR